MIFTEKCNLHCHVVINIISAMHPKGIPSKRICSDLICINSGVLLFYDGREADKKVMKNKTHSIFIAFHQQSLHLASVK